MRHAEVPARQPARHDAGLFYHEVLVAPGERSHTMAPPGHLLIARVASGLLERDTAGSDERFGAGDVFLVSEPHQPYSCWTPGTDLDLIGISLDAVAGVTGEPALTEPGRLRLTGYQPVSREAARLWHRTFDFVAETLLAQGAEQLSPLIADSTARLLAATVLATFPNNAAAAPEETDGAAQPVTVRRAIAFIEAHAGQDIDLAAIAAAAFVTPRAVQLAFRRHLSLTPMAYLRQLRLERAHADLLAADPAGESVTAIARRWGFPAPSRFTAHYRQAYGVTPSQTLRQN